MHSEATREKFRLVPWTIVRFSNTTAWLRAQQPTSGAISRREITGLRWFLLVLSILSSTFLFALDNTIVAAAQPQIVLHFRAVDRMAWLSVAFAAAAMSTNMLFGQLYTCLPPKWLYITSVVIFEVGSALCGAAWDMPSLIVGRAICGLGGIGMYVGVMALLADITTIQERPAYIGSIGANNLCRWAFYINLPFGAVILPVAIFVLPPFDPKQGASFRARLTHVDVIGAFLMLGATSTLVMAINFGGLVFEWNSPAEIALFSVSGAMYVALGCQQASSLGVVPRHRIILWDVLVTKGSRPTVALMTLVTGAGGCGIFVPVFFLPLFFQFTRGDGATEASLRLLPFIGILIGAVILQGVLLSRSSGILAMYMPWYTVGGFVMTAGGALMYVVHGDTSDAWLYGSSALLGAGVGMIAQAGFGVAQACVKQNRAAMTVALVALGQTGGITLSLAVSNTIFIHGAEQRLRSVLGSGLSKKEIHAAIGGVATDIFQNLPPRLRAAALEALVDAMALPYILIMATGALTVVLSLFMRREGIRGAAVLAHG